MGHWGLGMGHGALVLSVAEVLGIGKEEAVLAGGRSSLILNFELISASAPHSPRKEKISKFNL